MPLLPRLGSAGHTASRFGDGDTGYSFARLIHNWSRDLVLVTGGSTTLTDDQIDDLHARGIEVAEAAVTAYEGQGGKLSALRLSDGKCLPRHAVFMRPPMSLGGELPQQLGCALSKDGLQIVVDEMGQTSVPGVYAAGDMVSPMAAVIAAAASGTKAAGALNHEFVMGIPRSSLQEVATV